MWKPFVNMLSKCSVFVYLKDLCTCSFSGRYLISWEPFWVSKQWLDQIRPSPLVTSCLMGASLNCSNAEYSPQKPSVPQSKKYLIFSSLQKSWPTSAVFHLQEIFKHLASDLNLKSTPTRPSQIYCLFFLWSQGRNENTCGIWDQNNNYFSVLSPAARRKHLLF